MKPNKPETPHVVAHHLLIWRGTWLVLLLTCHGALGETLDLAPRSGRAPSGTEFIKAVTGLSLTDREMEIRSQILSGNIPDFLRQLRPVSVTNVVRGVTNQATFYVTPDYLAIGSDEDYLLVPMSPSTAQSIANTLSCSLPTRKMVDEIYAAAELKLAPSPIPPSPAMTTVPVFSNHNVTIRGQRAAQLGTHPIGALVAGHKKDVVISARMADAPGRVAIYGWHQTNGQPIQPLYLGHTSAWVDYSQCARLVLQKILINGAPSTVSEAFADPTLAGLLSDEGVVPNPRYPTNALAGGPVRASVSEPTTPTRPGGFSGFEPGSGFGERVASFTLDPEVKVLINAPPQAEVESRKRVLLVFYALPNGNTTDQTVGRVVQPGDDWHYDIQHLGAQTRFLRELLPDRALVVVYLENNLKSWPAWRKKYDDKLILKILGAVRNIFPESEQQVVLAGHSGGGSLIFGFVNAVADIPDDIARIAFLDSNYAYDRSLGHREKLVRWLEADARHALCVLAYNDAIALLDGKSFVSAAGGTWGKSHEMQRDFAEHFKFTSQTNAEFQTFSALDGRVQFLLKENPERKIFHTVQVERNGFIHALVTGTTNENRGYEYFGPRAYERWIGK